MLMLAAVSGATSASADNLLSVEPFTITGYDVVEVPVLLDNTDAVAALQFDVKLPNCLEMAGEPIKNVERMLNGHQVAYNPSNGRVMVTSRSREAFVGDSGVLLYLPVKVKAGELANETVMMDFNRISLSNATGSESWNQEAFSTGVTLQAARITAYSDVSEFVINPGRTQTVTVSMTNNCPIVGFQMDVVLPEGFIIEGEIVLEDRCSNGAYMDKFLQADGVTTRMILSDFAGVDAVNGNAGAVFSFTLKAPADFTAETATLSFNDLLVSVPGTANAAKGEGFSMTVVNGKMTYDLCIARIAALEEALRNALGTIAAEAPDVKDSFSGEQLATRISELRARIEADYDSTNLNASYEKLMNEADSIAADIEALVNDAREAEAAFKAEEARKAANEEAYNTAVAELDALQGQLDATSEAVATNCPHADVTAEKQAAQEAINAARDAAAKAYADVAEEGEFDYSIDNGAIQALITAVTEAGEAGEAAYNEALRVAANEAAHEANVKILDTLEQKLVATIAAVSVTYPDSDVTDECNAAADAITAARTAEQDAFDAVKEEGLYDYTVDTEAIEALIQHIIDQAKALGIETVTIDSLGSSVKVFNLQGVQVSNPAAGLYIITGSNGETRKVILK